ncbi:hypothetical protein QAD02_017729 [Eretmocerus hayati]|uniref:Uncharacterized protein n=1 Tax=Eretmocerus hayati TaxID=131215 RepID=A0ACC2PF20_9HYME|nr:hypothetical protein QAD02_017729 [Eretmocerus hayati]
MTKDLQEIDINEAFDNLLLAEDLAERAGYKEGFEAGKNQMIEGYHLGYHRATLIGSQLGYYFGVLTYLQQTSRAPKVLELSKQLIKDVEQFPVHNDESLDIFEKFDSITISFRKLCSVAKIDAKYSDGNRLEF